MYIYANLPPGYIARSTITCLFSATGLFIGYELFSGNELFYRKLVMPIGHRLFEPELAHKLSIQTSKYGLFLGTRESRKEYEELKCKLLGHPISNPIGLAAGFDKNAEAICGLRKAGFAFLEFGTVTPNKQPGNERPRVFRLTEDEAVINSYGFNNKGVNYMLGQLKKAFDKKSPVLIGVNLGKNKTTNNTIQDFQFGVKQLASHCYYLVINVSSPNTPGLRSFQSKSELTKLISGVRDSFKELNKQGNVPKLLVKISPDLSHNEMKDIAEICLDPKYGIDGLIVTNTSINRPKDLKSKYANKPGGLSGAPLRDISTKCVSDMYRLTGGKVFIIGCGGISTGAEAYEKIRAGASAFQIYTALIYQGFPVVGRIKRELVQLLRKDGYSNVIEAIGADHKKL